MSEENGNAEKSFNDDELQDIMNEIESLEKEFVEEGGVEASPEATAEETPEEAPAQEEPVAQEAEEAPAEEPEVVEAAQDEAEGDLVSEAENYEETESEPQAEVVAMPTQSPAPAASGEGHMQFSGQGNMDMQLNFQLGSETATVNVSGGSLNVKLAGVELQLSEEGCEVNMDGGVKFSVPLTGSGAQGKKAA